MPQTIIQSLRDFFLLCPALADSRINVDYLPEDIRKNGVEYSIDSTPAEEIITRYLDGSAVCQYQFVIRSKHGFTGEILLQLSNSGLYEAIAEWIRQRQRARELPVLPDGMEPRQIEVQSTGYLMQADPQSAMYQIQCRLVYFRKGER